MRGSSSLSPHWSYLTSSLHIYDFPLLLPNSSVLLLSLCVFTTRCRSEKQNQCSLKAKIFLWPMYLFGYVNKLIEIYGSCFSLCTLSRVMFQEYHQLFGSSSSSKRAPYYFTTGGRGCRYERAKVFQWFKYLIVNDKHRFTTI